VPHGVPRRYNIRVCCRMSRIRLPACSTHQHTLSVRVQFKTHGSSLYTRCPSSALSCTKRSSRETMLFIRQESITFSSGWITWLLTYVQVIGPHQHAKLGTIWIGSVQDEWAEMMRLRSGENSRFNTCSLTRLRRCTARRALLLLPVCIARASDL
jgi:hypothetical protein